MKKEIDEKNRRNSYTGRQQIQPPYRSSTSSGRSFTERRPSKNRAPNKLALYSLAFLVLGLAVLLAGWISLSFSGKNPTDDTSSFESSLPVSSLGETTLPVSSETQTSSEQPDPAQVMETWLEENPDDNTEELLRLLENNPDALSYICNYPEKRGTLLDCTLTQEDLEVSEGRLLPLFMQWDDRWGYSDYGGYLFGTNACGPTTLSMVAVQLLGDSSLNPRVIADFAEENGFVSPGGGSDWVLMSQGGPMLGLTVEEISPSESWVRSEVEAGHPVVCIMGPGHFTTGGHYIVICGTDGDKFLINDCNSYTRSNQSWDFDTFKDEIRNLWAFSYDE